MYTLFVLTFALLVALLGGVPLGNAFNGNSQKLYAHGPAAVMIERLMRVMRIVVLALLGFACGGSKATPPDALGCGGGCDAQNPDALLFPYTLDGNRDRLLHTYLWWLQSDPNTQQSNGLAGRDLHTVCDLWSKLDPSPRAVFLTITHRLEGSLLGSDHSAMLDHVTKLYRVVGGQGETATTAGSCGGAEYNRMIMSSDSALHDVQVAANTHQGAVQGTSFDIADITSGGSWRDSHDAAGPHAPFDLSDETKDGAPRGQTQYFRDPASTIANKPLGRMDVMTLVDPYALEMDQDYDCTHNSNPSCDYTYYGAVCAPKTTQSGELIYTQNYGDFGMSWKPTGC